ncbi:MAG: glycosyltransferase [Chloroflexi bacterium]|nr:glycosyltransferase [Chloroflexota bacterium]
MADGLVSVIIPTLNEGINLVDTVEFVLQNSGDSLLEVIVVDDGSTDDSISILKHRFTQAPVIVKPTGGIGVPGARNAGAAEASGEVLVFLDAHCFVPENWLQPLLAALWADPKIALVGPTFAGIDPPHPSGCGNTWKDATLDRVWLPPQAQVSYVPFHGGACHVVRANVFRAVNGYDTGMTRWGSQDLELCLRLWLMGYDVVAQPHSVVFHLFRRRHPYPVNGWDVLYNKLRMAIVHFDEARLQRVIRALLPYQGIEQVLARAMVDGTWVCRERMLRERVRDIDWLFGRFNIPV